VAGRAPTEWGFPPHVRLDRAEDYRRVFRRGKRSKDRFFTILACPNELERARLGMAIARKHAGNAVRRNRLKRLSRESFRYHQQLLSGLDLVVMSRPEAGSASNAELLASLESHWQRLNKRCAPFSSS